MSTLTQAFNFAALPIKAAKFVISTAASLFSKGGMLAAGIGGTALHFMTGGKSTDALMNIGSKALNFVKGIDFGKISDTVSSAFNSVSGAWGKVSDVVSPLFDRDEAPASQAPKPPSLD